jgi:hypothetical protein
VLLRNPKGRSALEWQDAGYYASTACFLLDSFKGQNNQRTG